MIKRVVLLPYKIGSNGCKELQQALLSLDYKCNRVRVDSRTFVPKRNTLYIYYGGTHKVPWPTPIVLNEERQLATNKIATLKTLKDAGITTVPWTTDPTTITKDWATIVARATLSGHSGEGITIHEFGTTLPNVPLYTKYIKKTHECRIHVFNGTVIDAQIKRKVRDVEEANTFIRNIHTGWVYCREDYNPTDECKQVAISAVTALRLNFGAVDIIYNQHYNTYYILEVNTAPGLTGTTLQNYIKEIINVCKTY